MNELTERGLSSLNSVAVVYATMTKHSKKLAEAVGKALAAPAENARDKPQMAEVDLLFILGGLYGNESRPELLEFVTGLDKSQVEKVALITSSVSMKHGQAEVRRILAEKGIEVIDELMLRGSFLFFHLGRPNKGDMAAAVAFALEKAGKA